jgi:hypothetical protein
MLKVLVSSATLFGAAEAAGSAGEGILTIIHPAAGTLATAVDSTPYVVADPIGTNNNKIDVHTDSADVTYVGLFDVSVPTSHTEQATGGPITKTVCVQATARCSLNLYQNNDVMNPVPAGNYNIFGVNGNDLDYASSILHAAVTDDVDVTISPYIAAWGSTLQQASSTVERGNDILVTWDGLAAGDWIEYRHTTTGGTDCAVDAHEITAAEAALTRGTVALGTSLVTSPDLVHFAIPGVHTITAVLDASAPAYTGTLACSTLSAVTTGKAAVQRAVTVADTDTITATPAAISAGASITLAYDFKTFASTSGTYVGIWKETDTPSSHDVSATFLAGHPLAVSVLPVGILGVGSIELATPVDLDDTPDYIVYMFNSNDANFEPVIDTSYITHQQYGPHVTSAFAGATDITVTPAPTGEPTGQPTDEPSGEPTSVPTSPTGQPTSIPSSSPSFVEEPWGEYVWTEKRHRKAGMCENQCSGHGTCEVNGNCKCFAGLDGEDEWTGPDCSSRTCPFDFAWVGASINSNNLHPWAECSNKGTCDRASGECQCFTGYEGAACQRTVCPDNCNDQGTCWPEKHLASKAGRVYSAPWDAMKHVGCLCDAGYRGPACDQQECPSGADPLAGYGNEAGRDCSGRGICDYSNGICACFTGFFGTRCQHQTTVM